MDVSKRSPSGNSNAVIWIIVAGIAIVVGGFLIASFSPMILPTQGSAQAQEVDQLFHFMLILGGAVFLLVEGALLFSVIRFRRKPGDNTDGPAIHGNTTLEFVWTVIPAIIVFVLTIYSYQVFVSTRAVQPNEEIVNVTAQRFAWAFTYDVDTTMLPTDVDTTKLDPKIKDQLTAGKLPINSPQLHTFVGQPMLMEMQTQDVIHSFWIPGMRVKQDVLPGRTTEIRFTPVEAGVYRIECAELCGSGHGNMAGTVGPNNTLEGAWLIVHKDEDEYLKQFLDPEMVAVLYPPTDPALLGESILKSGKYPCATCHTEATLGWTGNIGPNLTGIADRTQRLAATGLPDMQTYITHSIRHSQEYLVPGYGPLMPLFNDSPDQPNYMPDSDLNAIVAFLLTQHQQ